MFMPDKPAWGNNLNNLSSQKKVATAGPANSGRKNVGQGKGVRPWCETHARTRISVGLPRGRDQQFNGSHYDFVNELHRFHIENASTNKT